MEIVSYSKEHKESFKSLNVEWLEKHFYVEPYDEQQLSDPENEILNKGGLIFFACVEGLAVGTITLMNKENGVYELAKMAVNEKYQGRGFGKALMTFVIQKAVEINANELILYSNTKLKRAIQIYRDYGFKVVPLDQSGYERANIKMSLKLTS